MKPKFKIHWEYRLGTQNPDRIKYLQELRRYDQYLRRIGANKYEHLYKYFSTDFFHDSSIMSATINRSQIVIDIWRKPDLEDINDYREKNNIRPIAGHYYEKNPIIYRCVFDGFINRNKGKKLKSRSILDVEIFNKSPHFGMILVSNIKKTYWFEFQRCKVFIKNPDRIKELTKSELEEIPYCGFCKDKLQGLGHLIKLNRKTKNSGV